MDSVRGWFGKFGHLAILSGLLFVAISFARSTAGSVNASFWLAILILFSCWVGSFIFFISARKPTNDWGKPIFSFAMQEISILPQDAIKALKKPFWYSLLIFAILLFLLGAALFDDFRPYNTAQLILGYLKIIGEKLKLM